MTKEELRNRDRYSFRTYTDNTIAYFIVNRCDTKISGERKIYSLTNNPFRLHNAYCPRCLYKNKFKPLRIDARMFEEIEWYWANDKSVMQELERIKQRYEELGIDEEYEWKLDGF